MITNLFSIFDPSTATLNLNWINIIIPLIIIPKSFWYLPSKINYIFILINKTLYNEFKILLKEISPNRNTLLFISLFIFILFNNLIGLFPYIFTRTRHIIVSLALALPLWFSFIIYGWINHTNHIFAHLIPQGTPALLIPFIICIETISNIIRPGTLAIRLTANIIAGHLLITLLGNTGPSINLILLNCLIITQILLLTLESAVAIIQSYVFSILRTLYSRETSYDNTF